MAGIKSDSTENKTAKWEVTCHYDDYGKGKEPSCFMECMALFVLEKQQGWDDTFRPSYFPGKEACNNGGLP